MKLVHLTTYYPAVIDDLYRSSPTLSSASASEQERNVFELRFGWSDYLSNALGDYGVQGCTIVGNNASALDRWLVENDPAPAPMISLRNKVIRRIELENPDILFLEDATFLAASDIRGLRRRGRLRLVVAYVCTTLSFNEEAFAEIDAVFTCANELNQEWAQKGLTARLLRHAAAPQVFETVPAWPETFFASFVGSLKFGVYDERWRLLNEVSRVVPVAVFASEHQRTAKGLLRLVLKGNLPRRGTPDAKFRAELRPPVYGREMLSVIRASSVAINGHGDGVTFAANMRIFEATGCGCCLVTDWKKNLSSLFELDSEVVAYRSTPECMEKLRWLRDSPETRESIARAGKRRVLREHTWGNRAGALVDDLLELLQSRGAHSS